MTLSSARPDGRGHWPRGKRRSSLTADQQRALLAELRRVIGRGESRRGIARLLDVSDRTVRRWLDGTHVPLPAQATAIRRRLARL